MSKDLAVLPKGWKVVRLGEVVKLKSGTSRPDNLLPSPTENANVPVFGGNGILGYTSQIFSNDRQLVIGRVGAYCGCVHIANAPNWITDNALYSEKWLDENIVLDFVADCLRFSNLNSLQMKGGQPLITQSILHNFYIALPPLEEQRAIAITLRTIQTAKEARQKELALERERKAALMDYLFTHGTCNEPCKQTELGEIPESWEVIRLGEIVKLKSGTSRPDNLLSNPTENTNVPVFGGNGILGYTSQIFSSDRQLVIGRVGAYCGCVHIAEAPNWITDNALYSERFMGDISLDFIAEYLRFSNLNSLQMKGGQPLITQSILHKFYIILPSLIEQQEIANVLSSCDAKIATLEREIKLHDELFRAMLEELMTGQLSSLPLA